MPLKRPPKPEWPNDSTERANKHSADYGSNLKRIAETLARQEHCEFVLERHVDEAFDTLARLGLSKLGFWRRPELQITAGSILIGASWVFPDVLPVFFDANWLARQGVTIGCILTTFTIGVLVTAHGWIRARRGT
jgi:hypothetical protein